MANVLVGNIANDKFKYYMKSTNHESRQEWKTSDAMLGDVDVDLYILLVPPDETNLL